MNAITFNEVPQAISLLLAKMESLEGMIKTLQTTPTALTIQAPTWFDIHELSRYLPDKPAVTTIYSWVADKKIPFSKHGKKLIFSKDDVDVFLRNGRQSTKAEEREELRMEAETHLQNIRRK